MGMSRKGFTALLAGVAACAAFAASAGSAAAIVLAEDGQWCGIDEPQALPHLKAYLERYTTEHRYSDCTHAERAFDKYRTHTAKIVKFRIEQHQFLKEMFVGRHKWIGSYDIGRKTRFFAEEHLHRVHGTFVTDLAAVGTLELEGQTGHFYAIWVGP
jgi:hypothetical protein